MADDPRTFTVAAVGDVIYSRPPSPHLALHLLDGADLKTANLEGPITAHPFPVDKLVPLKMPPGAASWVRESGFDVVSLANNHAMDYGERGLLDTLEQVKPTGVGVVGAGADVAEALRPDLRTVAGVRVATIGVASTVPAGFAAGVGRPGVAPVRVHVSFAADGAIDMEQPGTPPWVHTRADAFDLDTVLTVVREARREADLVIVHVHWGVPPEWNSPFQGDLAEYQRPMGHALIDAGAQLIVGHHAHALLGAEVRDGGLILYSLGNFAFHPYSAPGDLMKLQRPAPPFKTRKTDRNMQSMVVHARFADDGRGFTFAEATLLPARLDAAGEARTVDVDDARSILDVVEASDANHGVRYERQGGVARLVPAARGERAEGGTA